MARCGVRVDSCRSYVEVLLDLRFRLLLRRGSRRCSAIRRQLVEVLELIVAAILEGIVAPAVP